MPRKTRKERFLKHAYALRKYHHMVKEFFKNWDGTYTMCLQDGEREHMFTELKSYSDAAENLKLFADEIPNE